jgi:hypothetical protein
MISIQEITGRVEADDMGAFLAMYLSGLDDMSPFWRP